MRWRRSYSLAAAALLAAALLWASPSRAQVTDAATINGSVKVTTGLTYQTILPALGLPPATRRSLTIQNNQASGTDTCYLVVGTNQIVAGTTTTATNITINAVTMTAAQASIVLAPGASYTRYFPYVPSDAIYATCTTTGDSIYVDTQ